MEIKISTQLILKILQILSWVILIGLCVEVGGTIVNTVITLFINPEWVKNYWEGADYLSRLYEFDRGYFAVITLIMVIVGVLKAIMFYLIVKLFVEKDLNMTQPFNIKLQSFILNLSYLALGIGLFSHAAFNFAAWLSEQGLQSLNLQTLHLAGADVWIFMAVILFVIVQIVKRGIEIQQENDLTI
ncbi:DUF2975 domain-containing protein [Aquiflexum sp. TKW24L]|uniref:DUF2975 domain-containing protein n=1 Tax=Aquiflexum sp. TKW24L TaxID=2942212 RepID=UPI0020BF5C79|nr:DUF2975 domain-containing protein [Aquiflexum sp. TKW24L]MCL6260929.1 DUF2975 domain-containing protein [Aquiflexum sp. TKW24L]